LIAQKTIFSLGCGRRTGGYGNNVGTRD